MRSSNRTSILDAAVRIVEASGITGVTLDSVATEAGLTKGGLMYHFPTREALLTGIHAYLARVWEEQLEAELEVPVAEATPADRLEAYARFSSRTATRAELTMLFESTLTTHGDPWLAVQDRWTQRADVALGSAPIDLLIARLAADGLWMYDSLSGTRMEDATRLAIADRLVSMVRNATPTS